MDWQIQTHSSEDDPSPLVDHNLYEMVQRDKNQSTYRKDFTPSVPSK